MNIRCYKKTGKSCLNILAFEEIIKELSLKYNMQDIDVLSHLVKSAEEIFGTNLNIISKNNQIYLVKLMSNEKINLNSNNFKKISLLFEDQLKEANKSIQINNAKKLLKNKTVIFFEILKKLDDCFVCTFNSFIAMLPFKNIPQIDFDRYIQGSKHYGLVFSYSYSSGEVVLNCKHQLVEAKKVSSVIFNIDITRVNRFYGRRVKIYANAIPNQTIINNIKMVYPNEKIIFFKDKNV